MRYPSLIVPRFIRSSAIVSALLLVACAPIAVDSLGMSARDSDAGAAAPVGPADEASTGAPPAADAGVSTNTSAGGSAFRSACGDLSQCNPDDGSGCANVAARPDAGVAPAPQDAGVGAAFDASSPAPAASTEACVPFATEQRAARCTTGGRVPIGSACASAQECAPGSTCADGVCLALCCARSTTCAADTGCTLRAALGAGARWLPVCAPLRRCDFEVGLVASTSPYEDGGAPCEAGTQCGFASEGTARTCVPVGRAREGEACGEEPCGPGLACVGSGALERCARLCVPGGPAVCGANARCRSHPALFGSSNVGYCAP